MSEGTLGYVKRVNCAIDYILQDLTAPLKLEDVARTAGLSPFHFHRIFKAMIGETLHQFAKRQRLERALYMMSHVRQRSFTDIALRCGFSSSSDFSRSFRQQYGITPSRFDLDTFRRVKSEELHRCIEKEHGPRPTLPSIDTIPEQLRVVFREIPARTVAYIRVFDPYRRDAVRAAYEKLLLWADDRKLSDGQWLGYMWDEPEIVGPSACRYDVAVVAENFEASDEVGRFVFPSMRVATITLHGDIALETRAIDWLYKTWLPESGYVPDDQPMFEEWIGRPFAHGSEHFEIVCMLPVAR